MSVIKLNNIVTALFLFLLNPMRANSIDLPYIEEFTLDNGMKVLVCPDYSKPTVTFTFHIDRGEIDDSYDMKGIAAYAISQSTLSTKKYKSRDDLNKALFALGISSGLSADSRVINDTQLDNTIFTTTFLKEDSKKGLEIMSELLLNATYQNKSYWTHWFMGLFNDNTNMASSRVHYQHLKNMYFSTHTTYYKWPPPYSSNQMIEWKESNVQPETTTLMVVGDVNILYIKKIVEAVFGGWQPTRPLSSKLKPIIGLDSKTGKRVRFVDMKDKNIQNNARLSIAFRGPSMHSPSIDHHASYLATNILAVGSGCRMQLNVRELFPASQTWAKWEWQNTDYQHITLISTVSHQYLLPFYKATLKELKKITQSTISKQELEDAKYLVSRSIADLVSDPLELSQYVLKHRSNGKSIEEINDHLSKYDEVTLDQVNEAASRLFNPNNFIALVTATKDSSKTFIDHFEKIELYNYDDLLK